MPHHNDTTNQHRIATATAAIVDYNVYRVLPDSAKAAQRRAWQAQLRAEIGCTEKTARKYVGKYIQKETPPCQ